VNRDETIEDQAETIDELRRRIKDLEAGYRKLLTEQEMDSFANLHWLGRIRGCMVDLNVSEQSHDED
jgi:hypothetical protein